MLLKDDRKTMQTIAAMLNDQYGQRIHGEQVDDLLDRLGSIDSRVVEGAIDRHMSDTTPDGRGQPVGAWPPTPANVLAHVQASRIAAREQRQAQASAAYRQESDRTYTRALASKTWRDQIERGRQIRAALVHRFNLDVRLPDDMRLIMQTLKAVQHPDGLGTAEEAIGVAEDLDV